MTGYTEQQTHEITRTIYEAHKFIRSLDLLKTQHALIRQNDNHMRLVRQINPLYAKSDSTSLEPLPLENFRKDGIAEIVNDPSTKEIISHLQQYGHIPAVKQIADELYSVVPELRN